MNTSDLRVATSAVRRGLTAAVVAVALLVGGAWHVMSASAPVSASPAVASTRAPTSSVATPAAARDSYADIVQVVAPAVVTVRVEGKAQLSPAGLQGEDPFEQFFGRGRRSPFGQAPQQPRTFRQRGLGSGVIVSQDGYILTNHHVAGEADDIRVELTDGRSFKAKLVGSDAPSDLAVLKIEATGLHTLPLGNSDAVRVGDIVLAVGNPLGIGQTVTTGIVSAKGRSTGVGDGGYEDFLQTDAPINQGNSGGALVNTKGELVGINSQILSVSEGNIGIGFAIPANMARHVMQELKDNGRVRRAQLGVVVQPLTSDMAESLGIKQTSGAIVSSVEPGSAADHAGVKRGDVVISFNGEPVRDTNTLRNRVAEAGPGSSATLVVVRDGSEKTLHANLDEAAGS